MTQRVRIEVQDQFGRWQKYRTVNNNPSNIKLALQAGLKTQLAAKSKKVRAINEETGDLLDILVG